MWRVELMSSLRLKRGKINFAENQQSESRTDSRLSRPLLIYNAVCSFVKVHLIAEIRLLFACGQLDVFPVADVALTVIIRSRRNNCAV